MACFVGRAKAARPATSPTRSQRPKPPRHRGTTFIPLSIPWRIRELFDHLLKTADAIADPFEQAFFAMVHIPYLHPFADVDKRTSTFPSGIISKRHWACTS